MAANCGASIESELDRVFARAAALDRLEGDAVR